MVTLKDLALAGFQMEKSAEASDRGPGLGKKLLGATGGLVLGRMAGKMIGRKVGGSIGEKVALKGRTGVISQARANAGIADGEFRGRVAGAVAGTVGGAIGGYKAIGSLQKKAGLLDVAKSMASTAKGVGSVAKNLVKQNPTAAKAAAGGALAGVALGRMSKGQEKQAAARTARQDHEHDTAVRVGAFAGLGAGLTGAVAAGDAHKNALKNVAGVNKIHSRANAGYADPKSALNPKDRAALYSKIAPSAKVKTTSKMLSKATFLGEKHLGRNAIVAGVGGAVAGGYAAHKLYDRFTKKAGAADAKDPGLAKEEKDDVGPFKAYVGEASGVGTGGTGSPQGKSSLVAAAKSEMAKAAHSKK